MSPRDLHDRFAFGANWQHFLAVLDDQRIRSAEQSLRTMLGITTLNGLSFLDVGSGSGLFSLAARRLGAIVHSFDYDAQSVACTTELRRRYFPEDPAWTIEQGSILDPLYVGGLGRFDIVYCWGVLHHTGHLDDALEQIARPVAPEGRLFMAIYNDQGFASRYWSVVKRAYNRNALYRALVLTVHIPYVLVAPWLARTLMGRRAPGRGMSRWHDAIDWLGGHPFEVATPEAIFRMFRDRGFELEELKTCGGRMGCNEFVFRRKS